MRLEFTLAGVSPLIMHNGAAGLDTRSALSRETDCAGLRWRARRSALYDAHPLWRRGGNRTDVDDKRLWELECRTATPLHLDADGQTATLPRPGRSGNQERFCSSRAFQQEELAHDGGQSDLRRLPLTAELAVLRTQVRVATDRRQHVEKPPHLDEAAALPGARLAREDPPGWRPPWREAAPAPGEQARRGDARHARDRGRSRSGGPASSDRFRHRRRSIWDTSAAGRRCFWRFRAAVRSVTSASHLQLLEHAAWAPCASTRASTASVARCPIACATPRLQRIGFAKARARWARKTSAFSRIGGLAGGSRGVDASSVNALVGSGSEPSRDSGSDGGDQTPFRPGSAQRLAVRPPPPPALPTGGRRRAVKLTNKRRTRHAKLSAARSQRSRRRRQPNRRRRRGSGSSSADGRR